MEDDQQEVDPAEVELKYGFQETPLTVVVTKVAEIMKQALAETSTKNYAALITKCDELTFPDNVKAQIPALDFKMKSVVSSHVKHTDDALISLER